MQKYSLSYFGEKMYEGKNHPRFRVWINPYTPYVYIFC